MTFKFGFAASERPQMMKICVKTMYYIYVQHGVCVEDICSHERAIDGTDIQKMKHFFVHFCSFCCSFFSFFSFELLSARTRLVKRYSTLCAVFAEVSVKSQPTVRASDCPSSLETSLWLVLSHMFPTRMNIGLDRFTRNIDSRKIATLSKLGLDVIE